MEGNSAPHTLYPVTPKRQTKQHDPKTPNRTEELAAVQTPRRSCRKSIKPIQDYENIVAQKGILSAKRIAISSLEDEAEPADDSKWKPSVIGRTSSKRGKKSSRNAKKKLKRQKRIEIDTPVIESVESVSEELPQHNDAVVINKVTNDVGQDENKENIHLGQAAFKNEVKNTNSKNEHDHKQVSNDELKASPITTFVVGSLDDSSDSSSSSEGGDVEMATMPITADDCAEGLDYPCQMEEPTDVNKRLASNSSNTTDYRENANAEQMNVLSEKLETGDNPNSSEPTDINMPPLFVCSEDEEDPIDLDKTSNGSDIVISITSPSPQQQAEENKTEQLNNTFDTDETSEKVMESITPEENKTKRLNNTFDADEISETIDESITPHTPILRPSISRIATPFKSNKATASDIEIVIEEEDVEVIEVPQLLVERAEVILKSSRKRSLSECIERPKKMVTFHSPANTTVSIYEADLMKSVDKKETNNVTQRRKRSLSVTETHRDMLAYIRDKRIVDVCSDKKRKLPKPSSATKMPNFAAIHQHHFKKMESISDHIARKAERAKVLSHSASKFKPSSVQKGLPSKNYVLHDLNKDHFAVGNKASALPVPKARKRIELFGDETKLLKMESKPLEIGVKSRSKSKPDLSTLGDDVPSMRKTPNKFSASTSSIFEVQRLKPKFNLTLSGLEAPLNSMLFKNETTTASKSSANISKAAVPHTKPKLPDPRQAFNRSTVIDRSAAPKEAEGDCRKINRLDMYKSRVTTKARETNKDILKGVRTNRRFELQMMYRNRPK